MRSSRVFRWPLGGGRNRWAVMLGLAIFVVGVYVLVVLGGGVLISRTDSPSLLLSVLATTIVALSFAPAESALERATVRWGRGTATPYDVLSDFSDAVIGAYAGDDVPARMAMLLAQGTGAMWAQVWLNVSGALTLAATWPTDAEADPKPPNPRQDEGAMLGDGLRALTVRHGSQVLGVLRLQERPGLGLTLVEQRLFAGLADQAGLVLKGVGLRAELDDRRAELVARSEQLRASRERLIETQDAERSRLERDLHDGAQQHLVALTVSLRLAHTIVDRSPERAASVLAKQSVAAHVAIETLSTLSRGIYPKQLAEEGLGAALRSAVAGSPVPVSIETTGAQRLPSRIEAAFYFCGMEAVQNAAKHSGAGTVSVHLEQDRDQWRLTVTDDGTGFDQTRPALTAGAGLANMIDRLDAVGGTVDVVSVPGSGTTVTAVMSLADVVRSRERVPLLHQVV